MIDWLFANLAPWLPMCPLEILATVFGLWSVIAYARENMWAWPAGLVNVLLYIALFWKSALYAETALQVIYVGLQLYGWWLWWMGGDCQGKLPITRTSPRLWGLLALIAGAAIVPIGCVLAYKTDSTTPWWDAIPTVLSLIAQWMISQKKLENWLVWIAVDLASMPLFAYKGLYLTAGLYGVFLVLCVIGLRTWAKTLRGYPASNGG